MAYKTVYNDIIFIEGDDYKATKVAEVTYKKTFYNQQSKTLDDVKDQLSEKAKKLGCNAVVCFTYGQKSVGWFRASLLALDDNINWYGNGCAANIPNDYYEELLQCFEKQS